MPKEKTAAIRKPALEALAQSVAKRLSRMEALLYEMRYEQDVQTRRIKKIREQIEALAEEPISAPERKPVKRPEHPMPTMQ